MNLIEQNSSASHVAAEGLLKEAFDLIEDLPVNVFNKNNLITDIGKFKNQAPDAASSQSVDISAWLDLFSISQANADPSSLASVTSQACYSLILLQDLISEHPAASAIQYLLSKDQQQQE